MSNFVSILIPLLLLGLLLRVMVLPIRLGWKLLLNGCCGFICPANRPLVETNMLCTQRLKEEKSKEKAQNG